MKKYIIKLQGYRIIKDYEIKEQKVWYLLLRVSMQLQQYR